LVTTFDCYTAKQQCVDVMTVNDLNFREYALLFRCSITMQTPLLWLS